MCWCRNVSRRRGELPVGTKVLTPSPHLVQTLSRVCLCLGEGLWCALWCPGHKSDCVLYLKLFSKLMNAGGNVGSSGQVSARWEAGGEQWGQDPAAIKFRHLMPVLPATPCCPCCDTPSLSSVCAILRTGPYNCFSSQKFLLERLFLKELWWLMQSWSVFPAISSSPMTSPACSVEGLCPPSALHRHVAQLSAGVQLGIGCLEH